MVSLGIYRTEMREGVEQPRRLVIDAARIGQQRVAHATAANPHQACLSYALLPAPLLLDGVCVVVLLVVPALGGGTAAANLLAERPPRLVTTTALSIAIQSSTG